MKIRTISAIAATAAMLALTVTAGAEFLTPTGAPTSVSVNSEDFYDPTTGESWIKIWNQWNETSMFTIDKVDADTKDIIISFDVEGCDGSYQAKTGFGINGWTPSIWTADDYTNAIGGIPEYTIDHDGTYEMTVPFSLFMQSVPFEDPDTGEFVYKEYLESVDCLELCISGVSEDCAMVITINDVIQSPDAHTFEECELSASVADTSATDTQAPAENKTNPDTGVEGAAAVAGTGALAAMLMLCSKRRSVR